MSNEEEIDKRVAGTEIAAMISKNAPDQRNGVLGSLGLIVDLVGKGRRRTVAVPYWVKQSVGQWTIRLQASPKGLGFGRSQNRESWAKLHSGTGRYGRWSKAAPKK